MHESHPNVDFENRKRLRNLKQARFSCSGDRLVAIGRDQGLGAIPVGPDAWASPWLQPWGTVDFSHIGGQLRIVSFAYGRRWLAYQGTHDTGSDRRFPLEARYKTYFLMAAHDGDPDGFFSFDEHPVRITALDIDCDDRWIAAAGEDRWLRMSRLPTKEESKSKQPYDSSGPAVAIGFDVVCISFSPDNKQLAVGGTGGELQLWSVPGSDQQGSTPLLVASSPQTIGG